MTRQEIRTGDRILFSGIDARRILNGQPCCANHARKPRFRSTLAQLALACVAVSSFIAACMVAGGGL